MRTTDVGTVLRQRSKAAPHRDAARPGGGRADKRLERDLPHAARRDFWDRVHHLLSMSELTVWFDGSCPLCQREIALMRRLDRRSAIRFVDAAQAEPEACPLDRGELLGRFHASENGRLLSGAQAFAATWRAIPILRPLGLAFQGPFASALLERLYRAFLRARPRLQKLARRLERS